MFLNYLLSLARDTDSEINRACFFPRSRGHRNARRGGLIKKKNCKRCGSGKVCFASRKYTMVNERSRGNYEKRKNSMKM